MLFWDPGPGCGRLHPLAVAAEAAPIELHRLLLVASENRRERQAARLPALVMTGDVDQDPEDPGLERGAALEPVQGAQDLDPGLLHHLFSVRPLPDVAEGHPQHRAVVELDEAFERGFLAGSQCIQVGVDNPGCHPPASICAQS